jgi:DNA-binding IclR family transcriptional regulator
MGRLAIEKTPHVLDLFSLERPEWEGCEAARELGIPKSTACELLISLNDQRLLRRTGEGRYRSGWRLFELDQTPLYTTLSHTEARRKMQEIVER